MKLFEMPKAELVKFDVEDVITTSGGEEEDDCELDGLVASGGGTNCY